ncbi:MAG: hypothetical protein HYV42_03500 [Candidatus Magasanikbacteria bacterium]|nr:hypothetical protein [Candidatus Magasanikbacteria bacterium]
MTVLAVLANAAAGVRAKETVPLRRLGGWLLLFGCGVVLAVLRGAASAEASWALTLFGFLIPLVGGLAAGVAHEQVGAFLKRRARYRARERETDLALRASAAEVRRLEAHEQERRRASGSPETVARDPAAEARGRRILQARLAAARWVYALGARFAGRAGSGGKGGDGHA